MPKSNTTKRSEALPTQAVSRYDVTDEQWSKVKPFLYLRYPTPAWEAKTRRFFNAVVFVLRAGCPWRDLPEAMGKWNSVFKHFNRWSERGHWQRLFEGICDSQDPDLEAFMFDSTIIRAQASAVGAKKKSGRQRRPS